ncbi:MAG: hypothetical protein KGL39_27160 [Patescibacteria group bacterium]|nr:hypothetical protein [Patescibacteria group bacterium]
MPTTIGQLWVPQIWTQAMRERQATFPALFNSGVVARADLFDAIAAGPGTSANVPFLHDITDQSDELQVENTAPTTDNAITGDVQNFPLCNRVKKSSSTALAKQLSGADPMAAIIDQLVENRLKNRQKTLLAMMRGLFNSAGAINPATGALSTMLYKNSAGSEPFTEDGVNANANTQIISPTLFEGAVALMGELGDTLKNGCMWVHPNVKATLKVLDSIGFKTLIRPSQLPFDVDTYHDIPLFTSVALARAGTTSGTVYETYLISNGTVGYGEKPQQGDTTDVASLQYWRDRDLNNELIWDRTRFLLGIALTKWIGNPANANSGPTNAELQTAANWSLVGQSANRVGAVCIRTNG